MYRFDSGPGHQKKKPLNFNDLSAFFIFASDRTAAKLGAKNQKRRRADQQKNDGQGVVSIGWAVQAVMRKPLDPPGLFVRGIFNRLEAPNKPVKTRRRTPCRPGTRPALPVSAAFRRLRRERDMKRASEVGIERALSHKYWRGPRRARF